MLTLPEPAFNKIRDIQMQYFTDCDMITAEPD